MSAKSVSFPAASDRSALQCVCTIAAGLIGLVYLGVYVIPNIDPTVAKEESGLVWIVAFAGLFSVAAAIGYGLGRTWGWYAHAVSMLAQVLFPGSLFELQFDHYHLIGWIGPLVSLLIVVLLGIQLFSKKKLLA